MKGIKKILAVMVALVMTLGLTATGVNAQTVGTAADGKGSITIKNAAKGETYGVVKLFDATVSATGDIAYTGDIPDSLKSYFTKDIAGNIKVTEGVDEDDLIAAVQAWAATQTVTETESDGTALTFAGLDYGYYAVKSSQGTVITITSTNPDANVYDKNSKTITVEKTVDKESYSIGDTITYTASFDTVNWFGSGDEAKQVINYEIQDTLPEFLSNVTVTGITVGGTPIATQQFANKAISIPWATEDSGSNPKTYTNLYNNGAKLVITYTAVLTDKVNINTNNINTVSIHPTTWNGTTEEHPWEETWQDDAEIKTHAAALKKTDGTNPLAGAQFTIRGLSVTKTADGVYTVVSYDPTSTTESAVLDTDSNGKLYIIGLASNASLTVTEYKAPDGYNKLTAPVTVPVQSSITTKIIKKSGYIKYDTKGNVIEYSETEKTDYTNETVNLNTLDATAFEVENVAGTVLPSTGGIGTTIFYAIGSVLVVGAGILLISKKRMFN